MNIWDILLVLCVAAIVAFAVRTLRKTKRDGGCTSCGSNCGCGCAQCKSAKTK